jgi:hypothetical protein
MHDELPSAHGVQWPRLLLLLPLAWWTMRKMMDAGHWAFLDYVNLAFHEAGHLFLSFAGETIHILGGTLGQLAVPLLLGAYFLLRQGQPFAAAVCAWWVGENLANVSYYMADARDLALPLVGGGEHDWNTLFFKFGILTEPWVQRISGATRLLGVVIMLIGLAWAGFLSATEAWRRERQERLIMRWPWLEPLLER